MKTRSWIIGKSNTGLRKYFVLCCRFTGGELPVSELVDSSSQGRPKLLLHCNAFEGYSMSLFILLSVCSYCQNALQRIYGLFLIFLIKKGAIFFLDGVERGFLSFDIDCGQCQALWLYPHDDVWPKNLFHLATCKRWHFYRLSLQKPCLYTSGHTQGFAIVFSWVSSMMNPWGFLLFVLSKVAYSSMQLKKVWCAYAWRTILSSAEDHLLSRFGKASESKIFPRQSAEASMFQC